MNCSCSLLQLDYPLTTHKGRRRTFHSCLGTNLNIPRLQVNFLETGRYVAPICARKFNTQCAGYYSKTFVPNGIYFIFFAKILNFSTFSSFLFTCHLKSEAFDSYSIGIIFVNKNINKYSKMCNNPSSYNNMQVQSIEMRINQVRLYYTKHIIDYVSLNLIYILI